jgi:hypothetical protein
MRTAQPSSSTRSSRDEEEVLGIMTFLGSGLESESGSGFGFGFRLGLGSWGSG